MKQRPDMYFVPITSRDLLERLVRIRPALLRLQETSREYDALMGIILLMSDTGPRPTGKSLQGLLGISVGTYRRWLEDVYDDVMELVGRDASVLDFRQVSYLISVPNGRKRIEFRCQLALLPRVGDVFGAAFLGTEVGRFGLYVDTVEHQLAGEQTEVIVTLREGRFDPYLRQLRYRARFEHKLTFEQDMSLDDWALVRYLQPLYNLAPQVVQPVPVVPTGRRGPWR